MIYLIYKKLQRKYNNYIKNQIYKITLVTNRIINNKKNHFNRLNCVDNDKKYIIKYFMRRNKSKNAKNISREFMNVLDAPEFGSKLLEVDGVNKERYER